MCSKTPLGNGEVCPKKAQVPTSVGWRGRVRSHGPCGLRDSCKVGSTEWHTLACILKRKLAAAVRVPGEEPVGRRRPRVQQAWAETRRAGAGQGLGTQGLRSSILGVELTGHMDGLYLGPRKGKLLRRNHS